MEVLLSWDAPAVSPFSSAQAMHKSCRLLRLQHGQVSYNAGCARLTFTKCSSSVRNLAEKSPSSTGLFPKLVIPRLHLQSTILETTSKSANTSRRPIPTTSCNFPSYSKLRIYRVKASEMLFLLCPDNEKPPNARMQAFVS
ncbi:hypothetical protein CcaCcLH18_10120 [Colletotrichum camelliae]|nr:hypothetical protein CcaCcLH18_10120 [Colletotrichum camelliae]